MSVYMVWEWDYYTTTYFHGLHISVSVLPDVRVLYLDGHDPAVPEYPSVALGQGGRTEGRGLQL